MADSPREAALKALQALLEDLPSGPPVERNAPEYQEITAQGLINLRDGDPGDPETFLSPVSYAYAHEVEIIVQVQKENQTARDTAMDALLREIGVAIAADPTLGGAVDMATPDAPEEITEGIEIETIKAALVIVTLDYVSTTPLG